MKESVDDVREDVLEEKIETAKRQMQEEGKTELCEELIRQQGVNSLAFAEIAFKKRILYPAILYTNASAAVRDAYIAMLENDEIEDSLSADKLLMVLAVIGDEKVFEAFQRWEKQPKKWREKLHVGPNVYALEGGWCIDETDKRQQLTYNHSYGIERDGSANEDKIIYGRRGHGKCPYCQSSYVDILTLDGRDERLDFLGIDGKIKISACLSCLPWEEWIFCRYEVDGECEVLPFENGEEYTMDDETIDEIKMKHPLVLTEQPVSMNYCDVWTGSAVGGKPQWLDDAQYAICPKCGKRMKHLAQLGQDDTGEAGNLYIQICTSCQMAATCYQQS